MYFINLLKKSVIDSQLYVSLMGTFLAAFFLMEQNSFSVPMLILVFITFWNGYMYTKFQNSIFHHKEILAFSAISSLIVLYILTQYFGFQYWLQWLFISCLGILYNSFFLSKNFRNIPLFKIFYVGLTWALVNGLLILDTFSAPIFWSTFLYISALVLPFDIRDIKVDKVKTIPQVFGIKKTKIFASILLLGSGIIAKLYLQPIFAIAFIISVVISMILILITQKKYPDLYFSFLIETCCGLPLFLLALLQLLQ